MKNVFTITTKFWCKLGRRALLGKFYDVMKNKNTVFFHFFRVEKRLFYGKIPVFSPYLARKMIVIKNRFGYTHLRAISIVNDTRILKKPIKERCFYETS